MQAAQALLLAVVRRGPQNHLQSMIHLLSENVDKSMAQVRHVQTLCAQDNVESEDDLMPRSARRTVHRKRRASTEGKRYTKRHQN